MIRCFAILTMLTSGLVAGNIPRMQSLIAPEAHLHQSIVQQALTQLNQYTRLQGRLHVQKVDAAYRKKQALTMADLLINADGTLNYAAAPSIKSAFISEKLERRGVYIAQVLDQLDSSWEPFFASITAPKHFNQPGNLVLRALFGLTPTEDVTDRHAKVAVLSAMLSSYYQSEDHRAAANDYLSILKQGFLRRTLNNRLERFFFLPVLADTDLNRTFELTLTGDFPDTRHSLFEAPGFAAARNIMGGANMNQLTDTIMQSLANDACGDMVEVTPAEVISAMAEALAVEGSVSPRQLSILGNYAFSSLTNNPLACAIMSADAAIANETSPYSVRRHINECMNQVLQSTWLELAPLPKITQFQNTFTQVFNNSYHLVYHLNIAVGGVSVGGGFQLYKRIPGKPAALGTRVASPQNFRRLVIDALVATTQQLGNAPQMQKIKNHLITAVRTDDFLRNVLWTYDPANQSASDPVLNYLKLAKTPMQTYDRTHL